MNRAQMKRQALPSCISTVLALFVCQSAQFFGQAAVPSDLSALSLEQLTTIDVSSVARRDQQLYKTPSAGVRRHPK